MKHMKPDDKRWLRDLTRVYVGGIRDLVPADSVINLSIDADAINLTVVRWQPQDPAPENYDNVPRRTEMRVWYKFATGEWSDDRADDDNECDRRHGTLWDD